MDFDPDSYLDQKASTETHFDPDAYLDHPDAGKPTAPYRSASISPDERVKDVVRSIVSKGVVAIPAGFRSIGDLFRGKSAADISNRYHQFIEEHSYQPRDQAGKDLAAEEQRVSSSAANPLTWPGRVIDAAGTEIGLETGSPVTGAIFSGASQGALALAGAGKTGSKAPSPGTGERSFSTRFAAEEGPKPRTAEEIIGQNANASPQSMGAAAAAPRMSQVSPALRSAVEQTAQRSGGIVNPDALARHVEADTLPVPVRLTEGEATGDVRAISHERNNPDMAEFYKKRSEALTQNLQALRDEVGPDVFSANTAEHGDTLIAAYKAKDEAIRADISAKYKALEDAAGGDFPVDGKVFVKNADAALKKKMKAPFLPGGVQSTLASFRDGEPMTFENFENLRTTLAAEGRKAERAGDGNAASAINLVREQLESLPMSKETGKLKQLADEARSAAKARFDALRADPAYNAAVNDSVAPDKFTSKFITGPTATRDAVATMRENLKDDPVALQTMGVAAVDHLRDGARINPNGTGVFTQAGYNKALRSLDPKLRSVLNPNHAELAEQLGNVARTTQEQPAGNFINNSKTFVASMASHGATVVEHGINAKAGGLPIGTYGRNILEKRARRAAVKKSTAPGAGLDRVESP